MRPGAGGRCAIAAAVLAAASLFSAPPLLARKVEGVQIRDLHYGEVLFYFYQQEQFSALTHLLAARQVGRVSNHAEEAELLLGGLYLSYGQHTQAGEIFERLLTAETAPDVRDRAWFYLGKVRYQRGLFGDALDAFARVEGRLPRVLASELHMLRAQSHMGLGDFASAAAVLDDWDGAPDWLAFSRYNLGVALVRLDRVEAGAAMLDQVGLMDARTPELRSLRDKANLAMGYAYLQAQREPEAKAVLQRVRLSGPFSNKALLGVGWADAAAANYRAALVPWLELRDRDLLDSAVQESLLAVPYAFGRLDAHGSAAEHYQFALAAFDAEMGRLENAIGRARSGGLIPALLKADDPGIGRWYWQLREVPDSVDSRYLYHLVANHDFQDGLRNYRDLAALDSHLDEWQEKLGAFQDMIDTRRLAYEQKLPVVDARLQEVDLEELRARRDELRARIDTIEQTRDVAGLANEEELVAWQSLQALASNPAFKLPKTESARHRQRVLKGHLLWNLDAEYKYRLWQQQRSLAELDAALEQAESFDGSIFSARADEPQRLETYAQRIAGVSPRLQTMRGQITAALDRQEQSLQIMAVRELEAQKERLATYRVQARFALANIYDRATAAAD
jgi:hypothetical protein